MQRVRESAQTKPGPSAEGRDHTPISSAPSVVILAGGLGTRLSEETQLKPKAMVEIGGRPILWHILKCYAAHGFNHFVIALGYRGDVIRNFFLSYHYLASESLRVDTRSGTVTADGDATDDWTVDLVDTGLRTNTGGRLKRLLPRLPGDEFCVTYGDGLSTVDISRLLAFHRSHGRLATVTAVRPPARFGGLILDGPRVQEFTEKPQIGEGWINGGFMILNRGAVDYAADDQASLEVDVLERLAKDGELMAYRHEAFWQCMDTLRDVRLLEALWETGEAPWRTWS